MPLLRSPTRSQGNLLGLLTAVFYGLFTLLPDSNSLMVSYPWVFIWQVGWLCPVLWLLGLLWQGELRWLGDGFDWLVGFLLVGLVLSAGFAEFPEASRWQSWIAFCWLAALYALSSWLSTAECRRQLLTAQGYLSLGFIGWSLLLWVSQTWLPELGRLEKLRQAGVDLAFDFATVELRNWAPIGHQNYVAGYLVLALPLLLALAVLSRGWQRCLWSSGGLLGLVTLYTTSSRGGWLGLLVAAVVGAIALVWQSQLPRLWRIVVAIASPLLLILVVFTNSRFQQALSGILSGQAATGELAYRLITIMTGWQMGLSKPLLGVGLGNAPLLFQKFRPTWAGREAELAYQLHSTPAQLWAELGSWAVITAIGAIALLIRLGRRWLRQPKALPPLLVGSLFIALIAYAICSLTDYQLDNVCISGMLMIYLAVLVAELRSEAVTETSLAQVAVLPTPQHPRPFLPLAGLGILLVAVIWLIPIHLAWMTANQGFLALAREDVGTFGQQVRQAADRTPWEPYYLLQLGWNLGDLSLKIPDPTARQAFANESIGWFQKGIKASPYQEFGYTNLAWLRLRQNPSAATAAFAQSARLVPAKRGVFYGLGLSLLAQGKADLAASAIALELIRDLELMTSPIWRSPQLLPLYQQAIAQAETRYTAMIQQAGAAEPLATQLHQSRAALRWWQGNLAGAQTDLQAFGKPLARFVVDLAAGKTQPEALANLPDSAGKRAIAAWFNSAQRSELLQQAWILATRQAPPADLVPQLVATMNRSTNLEQWLKQNPPIRSYRRERAGFGVLSRHIDGPNPTDFLTTVENIPVVQFFDELVPSFVYAPEFDLMLQRDRDRLLAKISQFTKSSLN